MGNRVVVKFGYGPTNVDDKVKRRVASLSGKLEQEIVVIVGKFLHDLCHQFSPGWTVDLYRGDRQWVVKNLWI